MSASQVRSPSGRFGDVTLPVIATGPRVRASRSGRRRALVLALVHLVIILHVAHWFFTGRTISPIEPSESMETLETGRLNAGFIFFAVAIVGTLIFGRFICGWGCHWIAYQDLCGWVLRKIGLKPRPLRARLLIWVPMIVAVYMFVWPRIRIWWLGVQVPPLSNHVLKTEFWETFPGWGIAIISIILAGFAIVYFLGNKGFCTYACPYGAFFGLADKISPMSIRVTDACAGCGHCTATCTSNVRVHEEVRDFGMVVDPGCMKTLDCVSVCPNDALYYGFGRPTVLSRRRAAAKGSKLRAAFNWPEEILLILLFGLAFFSIRGLYQLYPLLASLGIAGIVAFLGLMALRLTYRSNVRLHNFVLKRTGRLTRAAWMFVPAVLIVYGLVLHSGLVQYHTRMGVWYYESGPRAEKPESSDAETLPTEMRRDGDSQARSLEHFQWVDRWSLLDTVNVSMKLGWLHAYRREFDEAERYFRRAIQLGPDQSPPRLILAGLFMELGRPQDALPEYLRLAELEPDSAEAHYNLGVARMALRQTDEAIRAYRRAVELAPDDPEAHNNLGLALANTGQLEPAVSNLNRALELRPGYAEPHFNLARIFAATGNPEQAREHIRAACALDHRYCDFQLGPSTPTANKDR